jgi:hypothetical protein
LREFLRQLIYEFLSLRNISGPSQNHGSYRANVPASRGKLNGRCGGATRFRKITDLRFAESAVDDPSCRSLGCATAFRYFRSTLPW